MVELRPMIVVTGTLHVEGGLTRERTKSRVKGPRVTVTEDLDISKDRRSGNVVAARYLRRLSGLKVLHTPYGILVDPRYLDKVKDTVAQATIDCQAFNRWHAKCKLLNTMVWEHLKGNRLDAITAWIDRRSRDGDESVTAALGSLIVPAAA
jgi:hypothetical protein